MMNLPQVLPPNSMGFSSVAINKINNHLVSKTIFIDEAFYKEYLNILNNISVDDAKRLIHIHKYLNKQSVDFAYYTEEDIITELTTIVSFLDSPSGQLRNLLSLKSQYSLPSNLHKWIENDLSAMLIFYKKIVFSAPYNDSSANKSFAGGEEFKSHVINFLQFNVFKVIDNVTCLKEIEYHHDFDLPYWIGEYERYKTWYLNHITPKKNFDWLEKCKDEQLDKLIDNLDEKNLVILKGFFYPRTREDKIALITASINDIEPEEQYRFEKVNEEETIVISLEQKKEFKVRKYNGFFLFVDHDFNIEYDKEKYEGVGVPIKDIKLYDNILSMTAGDFKITKLSKLEKKVSTFKREYYLNQLKNTARKQKERANEAISQEECTVKILKKNISKLEELAKSQNTNINKYTNKLIEISYESANSK